MINLFSLTNTKKRIRHRQISNHKTFSKFYFPNKLFSKNIDKKIIITKKTYLWLDVSQMHNRKKEDQESRSGAKPTERKTFINFTQNITNSRERIRSKIYYNFDADSRNISLI